jgi:glycine betaine/choline ABC-type transport system substrate-binding protein
MKEGDEILIYEHYTGELVFEYSKDKEVDKTAYKEFEDTWKEVKSYKATPIKRIE